MKSLWPAVRWGVAAVLVAGSVAFFIAAARHTPGPHMVRVPFEAPALRTSVPSNGLLFVIARQGDGPPLAVKRIANPTFPLTFGLGEEDRMAGQRPFEGEVTLVARFKRDGAAGPPGPGDIEGRARTPVKIGQRGIDIVLDKAY